MMIPLLAIWDSFYGALSTMMQPIYWAVSGILVLFHSLWSGAFDADSGAAWTLSIISMTVLIRTLLIPLFVKQINSARNMQLLQPKIQALQKKHAGDKQKLGEEQMKLYKQEGVNPAASCVPLLIQMPILLSLFRVLQGVADGQIRGKFFKDNPDLVASLAQADLFGAGLSDRLGAGFPPIGATQILGGFLVIAMVTTLFITQLQLMRKNMPPEALTGPLAQQQKMMLYIFPIMYLFSGFVIPIGVLIYWFTTNLWTMVQQALLIRNNPAPNTPAYIDWEERLRAKGKDPKEVIAAKQAKRSRKKTAKTSSRTVGGATAVVVADGEEETPSKPSVARQEVTRSTVRSTNGKTVVSRQQPRSTSRSTRKKK
ncbi:MAG: membrane protein insertase YidC [Arachnia sp.]